MRFSPLNNEINEFERGDIFLFNIVYTNQLLSKDLNRLETMKNKSHTDDRHKKALKWEN